jgi:hypothetical protein
MDWSGFGTRFSDDGSEVIKTFLKKQALEHFYHHLIPDRFLLMRTDFL